MASTATFLRSVLLNPSASAGTASSTVTGEEGKNSSITASSSEAVSFASVVPVLVPTDLKIVESLITVFGTVQVSLTSNYSYLQCLTTCVILILLESCYSLTHSHLLACFTLHAYIRM